MFSTSLSTFKTWKNVWLSAVVLLICYGQVTGQRKLFGRQDLTGSVALNNAGKGFGLQYEYFIDEEERKASLVAPLYLCFGYVQASRSSHGAPVPVGTDQYPLMIVGAPGVRYYPCGSSGLVRYAVGVSFLIGNGKGAGNTYTNSTNDLAKRSIFGLLVANSINFQASQHFKIAVELDLGLGGDYSESNTYGPGNLFATPLGQISFSAGYRW